MSDQLPKSEHFHPEATLIGPHLCGGIALVVLAALVVCLGASIVAKVREVAMRHRSENNIREICLAIHSYHDGNNGRFPIMCEFGHGSSGNRGLFSLPALILPYVEGGNIYYAFNALSPSTYYRFSGFASTVFRSYISPADPHADSADALIQTPNVIVPGATAPNEASFQGYYAATSYAASGLLFKPSDDLKGYGLKDITDGTSQTLMVGERHMVCESANGPVSNLWAMGSFSATTPSFALRAPDGPHPHTTNAGWELRQFVPPSGVKEDSDVPPGFQVQPRHGGCDPRIMQTPHRSGMLAGMADGSVRTISPSIKPTVFWSLVTPAGGEQLGGDW